MTDEQKKLFKATICAMLPYGLRGQVSIEVFNGCYDIYDGSPEYDDMDVDVELNGINVGNDEIDVTPLDDKFIDTMMDYTYTIWDFVPYLRSWSKLSNAEWETASEDAISYANWMNEHFIDANGLIREGLAEEATERIYPKFTKL